MIDNSINKRKRLTVFVGAVCALGAVSAVAVAAAMGSQFVADGHFKDWQEIKPIINAARIGVFGRTPTLRDYDNALLRNPRDAFAFFGRGSLKEVNQDFAGAIADYSRAIALNPKDDASYLRRGSLRAWKYDQKGANADFDQALKLAPGDSSVYVGRAWARMTWKDEKGALADMSTAIKLHPRDAYLYYWLGDVHASFGNKKAAIADYSTAFKLDERDYPALVDRGRLWSDLGDDKRALVDLNQSIKIEPHNAEAYSVRGQVRLHSGDSKGAVNDFNEAALLDPEHALQLRGRGYALQKIEAKATGRFAKELAPADLVHGAQQLRRMLADRPPMAKCVSPGDPVWTWAVRQFAGEGIGSRIWWHTDLNDPTAPACHQGPDDWSVGSITLSSVDEQGRLASGEELWSRAVFELYNIRNTPLFQKINSDARERRLTREQYIRDYCHAEWDADLLTAWFYRKVWLPHGIKNDLPTTDSHWGVNDPESFEPWFARFTDKLSYPYSPYGKYYDDLTGTNKARTREELRKVIASTTQILQQTPRSATALESRAEVYFELHEFQKALADLDVAVQIEPSWPQLHSTRADLLERLGKYKECIAACNKALALDPKHQRALTNRAVAEFDLYNFRGALDDCTASLRINNRSAWTYSFRAEIYRLLSKYDKSVEDCTASIRLDPKNAYAYGVRGASYRELQKHDLAISDLSKALELEPNDPSTLQSLANVYNDQHEYAKGLECIAKAIKARPNEPYNFYVRAVSLTGLGRHAEATRDFSRSGTR